MREITEAVASLDLVQAELSDVSDWFDYFEKYELRAHVLRVRAHVVALRDELRKVAV